jgi:recombination associated protein RdgC
MWFKQVQIFQLTDAIPYAAQKIIEQLEPLSFTPCLPSLPSSAGWVSPLDEENAPLVQAMNGNILLCLQIEEKILPGAVVRQELNEKIKAIQLRDDRRVRQKEKLSLKDEVMMTLLPRAFTKLLRLYAYIDTKNNWLVLGTTNAAKTEQFMLLFKRSLGEGVRPFEVHKPAPVLTNWLKDNSSPTEFSIEKACVLQDPALQNRIIRCQQQDLFAHSIQSIIKEGCLVKQLALCWHDRVNFVLADDFSIRSIQYQEEVIAAANDIDTETKQQQFDADFFIMTETLGGMITDLLQVFAKEESNVKEKVKEEEATAA